jgi:uncharacterized protein YndB with AHSA1/START domain
VTDLSITRTVHIQAHRAAVWAALTEAELVSEWFGDTAELDLAVGGTGVLGWDAWGNYRLVIEEIDEPRVFAWRWAREPDVDPAPGTSTLVRFTMEDAAGGTSLTVLETGWNDLAGDVEAAMKGNEDGWIEELDELVAFLEKQDSV